MTTINNMRTFTETVKTKMVERLADYVITEHTVVKMNDMKMHGLVATRKGDTAGATFYMNEAYERYTSGESMEHIIDTLVDAVLHAESIRPISADRTPDLSFESIKDHLILRLIDTEKNILYLQEHPFREIGAGLALVADADMGGGYRMVISNDIAKDYDLDSLFDTAIRNMESAHPARLMNMMEYLNGIETNYLDADEIGDGLYTLTIDGDQTFGASAIAYTGIAEKVYKLFGSFYLLPSSLHEFIIIKDTVDVSAQDLKAMVTEANRTVVNSTDVLSDSVFYFGAEGLQRVA